jgi:CRISPR-associated protein Cmr1
VMEAFASRNKGTEAGQLTRPMIPGGEFTVALKFSSSASDAEKRQVRNALVLLGTVGSMGSKSRKGYGSLTLTHLDNGNELELPVDPAQRLKRVLKGLSRNDNAPLPEWTAWSGRSRIVTLSLENARSVEILDKLGREMVHYRSWGKDGTVLGKPREGNFKEDHDLYYKKPVSIQHPKRIAFGLPHNYGKKPDETVEPAPTDLDRRASPLFLHVHQLSENSHPIGVVTFLPARFLPNDTQIKAFGTDVPLDTSDSFWDPIREFLKRLQGTGTTTQRTTLVGKEVSLG